MPVGAGTSVAKGDRDGKRGREGCQTCFGPLIGPHVLRLPRCSSPEAMLSLIGRLGCHSDLVWGLPFPEVTLALIGPLVARLLCCEVPPFT